MPGTLTRALLCMLFKAPGEQLTVLSTVMHMEADDLSSALLRWYLQIVDHALSLHSR